MHRAEQEHREQRHRTEGGRGKKNGLALEPHNKLEQEVIQDETHTKNKTARHTHKHEHMCTRAKTQKKESIWDAFLLLLPRA